MDFSVHGIKCDNKECDYSNMNVHRREYKSWINQPCPECGENLLTQKDYEAVVRIEKIMNNPLVKVISFLDKALGKVFFWSKPVEVEMKMNGTGKISINQK